MHPVVHGVILGGTILIMLVGLVGTILPMMPGCALIFGAALLYGLLTAFARIGAGPLIALGIIAAVVQVSDYLAGAWGAKRFGGGREGIIGAIVGGIVGTIVLNLPGLILGTVIGAVVGELVRGRKFQESATTGLGTLVGFLAGTLVRVSAAVIMLGIFIITVVRG
jgi:uncharacterized protein YqgC (DUF456 family)